MIANSEVSFFTLFNVDFSRFPGDDLYRRLQMITLPLSLSVRDTNYDFVIEVEVESWGNPSTWHLSTRDPAYDALEFNTVSVHFDTDGTDLRDLLQDSILDRLETAVYDKLVRLSRARTEDPT